MDVIYVIGIGPGAPSYGLLGSEEIYKKADYILGSVCSVVGWRER